MQHELWIADCVTGEAVEVVKTPLAIGPGSSCDLTTRGGSSGGEACRLEFGFGGAKIEPRLSHVFLDGKRLTQKVKLEHGKNYTLQIDASLFIIRVVDPRRTKENAFRLWRSYLREPWVVNRYASDWDSTKQYTLNQLVWLIRRGLLQRSDICYPGRTSAGFSVEQLSVVLPWVSEEEPPGFAPSLPVAVPVSAPAPAALPPTLVEADIEHGEFTCPVCWLKFDRGDVMHIAIHDELRGDTALGADAMLRFHATRFNDRGQALDPKGIPCLEIACPHCRRALPHGYLDVKNHIFSIVGAPSSGKSYYLSTLIRCLQTTLHLNFDLALRDFHPEGNRRLNAMKTALFGASSPEDAWLNKTDLEGDMYERLPRFGQNVALPKPFIYSVVPGTDLVPSRALVFYDNAGEHFEPGRDSVSSPGAQHLASSAGIFFLFDPTSNADFRRRLKNNPDPQMSMKSSDQQDVILSETEIRVKRLLGLRREERISVPFAMIIGKCDVWLDDLGRDRLRPVISKGALDLGAVRHNSDLIHNYLEKVCPYVVATADSLAEDMCYFAVSALGHTPVRFVHHTQGEKIGPDPARMNPMFVEIPTLWVLSKVAPDLIPSFQ
jgi:hypothetical protein